MRNTSPIAAGMVLLVTAGAYGVSQTWDRGTWDVAGSGSYTAVGVGVRQIDAGTVVFCFFGAPDMPRWVDPTLGTGRVRLTRPVPPGLDARMYRVDPACTERARRQGAEKYWSEIHRIDVARYEP